MKERNIKRTQQAFGDIDLFDLFSFYRARIFVIGIVLLVGAIIALGFSKVVITPKYTATSKMYMVSSSTQSVVDLTDLNVGTSISSDYVELLKARPIIESVIEEEGLSYTYKELIKMLKLSVISDTRIVQINVTSKDKREAMKIANAIAEKGVKELPKLMETPEPHIAEYAIIPVTASSPNLFKNTVLGAIVGLFLIITILTIKYITDDTLKTSEDIKKEFGSLPLSVIPEGKITTEKENRGKKADAQKDEIKKTEEVQEAQPKKEEVKKTNKQASRKKGAKNGSKKQR